MTSNLSALISEQPGGTILPGRSLTPRTSDLAAANRRRLSIEQEATRIAARVADLKTRIGIRYADCTLGNYEISGDSPVCQRKAGVIAALTSYGGKISHRIKCGVGIAMFGAVGCGKDHLLSAMMIAATEAGFSVEWRDGMQLASEFRGLIQSDETESQSLQPLIDCDVLAISDPIPPTGGLSPFVREKLFAVVDARYRAKRPTWLTLNVATRSEAEERLSPQIIDRITDGALCLSFDWSSYRASRRWTGETIHE